MKRIFLLLLASIFFTLAKANNVQVTNVTTTISGGNAVLNFNIQWDNSWRGGPANNWDAVWIFVKAKNDQGWFAHLDLADTLNSAAGGLTIDVSNDHKGAFIFRSTQGFGNIASSRIALGLRGQAGNYDIKVFAIEMVYIPTGSFFLGHSGGNSSNFGMGATGGSSPFPVTSAYPPYISAAGNYLYDSRVTAASYFGSSTWPTGYNAFYIMKYELSQAGYRDFLNSAPGFTFNYLPERTDLTSANLNTQGAKLFPASYRNNLYIGSGATQYYAGVGANANGNTTYDEATDGEWVAANYLYWSDDAAFLDWAALRPMTEFEYEKAVNGPDAPGYPQFATGSYYQVNSGLPILNPFTSSEAVTRSTANINYINTSDLMAAGPLRSGFAADATSTRTTSGGSYYGVMELSGNVWEPVVTAANVAGRSFDRTLGDGNISGLNGRADQPTWPGIQNVATTANTSGSVLKLNTAGISKKGGGFLESLYYAVSDENYDPSSTYDTYPTTRAAAADYGCRGVRQADNP